MIKQIFEGFLAKTLNMAPEQVASTLYTVDADGNPTDEIAEGALERLATAHAEHVKTLKGTSDKKVADDQYKRGIREGLATLEKELKTDFGIESTATRADLVKEIVAAKSNPTVTDDAVKIHPLYLQIERKAKADADAVRAEYEGKIAEIENGQKRRATIATVKEKALAKLAALRPVLEANQTVAANRQNDFAQKFEKYDYEFDDKGNVLVLLDGKRLENDHGHPIDFDSLAASTAAQLFEFHKTDAKGSPGNKGVLTGEKPVTVGKFADRAEYESAYRAEKDPVARGEIIKQWKEQVG